MISLLLLAILANILIQIDSQTLWNSLCASQDLSLIVATIYGGQVYFSTDYGHSFTQSQGTPMSDWANLACDSSGINIIAAQAYGEISTTPFPGYFYTSSDSAQTWTKHETPSNFWNGLASNSDGSHIAVGACQGHVFTSSNTGELWIERTNSVSGCWIALSSDISGQFLVGSTSAGIFYSLDYGESWSQGKAQSEYYNAISSDSTGRYRVAAKGLLYRGTYDCNLIYSDDFGVTWTISNDEVSLWQDIACSLDGQNCIAVSSNHYAATSSDYGVTWIFQKNSPTNLNGVVSDISGQKIYAYSYEGYSYESNDSGVTWTAFNITLSS